MPAKPTVTVSGQVVATAPTYGTITTPGSWNELYFNITIPSGGTWLVSGQVTVVTSNANYEPSYASFNQTSGTLITGSTSYGQSGDKGMYATFNSAVLSGGSVYKFMGLRSKNVQSVTTFTKAIYCIRLA